MSRFQKATRSKARLRLALDGASGTGKTYTALKLATLMGWRAAVIETERGSASKYAGEFEFDVLELQSFAPRAYVEAIKEAEAAGCYDLVIIDSLSHAWAGVGGALEMKDSLTRKSKSGNSWEAWRQVTPEHNALVDAMLSSSCHIIATMRVKTEWVVEKNDEGRNVPKKVGLAAVQREGMEYEFDVYGDLDTEHVLTINKARVRMQRTAGPNAGEWYNPLDSRRFPFPGQELANILRAWLSDGAQAPVVATTPAPDAKYTGADDQKVELVKLVKAARPELANDKLRLQRLAQVLTGRTLNAANVAAAISATEPEAAKAA